MLLERFDDIRTAFDTVLDVDVYPPRGVAPEEIRAEFDCAPVDGALVSVSEVQGQLIVSRSAERIATSGRPLGIGVFGAQHGFATFVAGGREFTVGVGDLCLLPGTIPFVSRLSPSYRQVMYLAPLEVLAPYFVGTVERAPCVVNARSGFARVLAMQMSTLATHAFAADSAAASRFNTATQHLLSAVFGAEDADTTAAMRNISLREAHKRRVLAVIARHFTESELDPEAIARHCRISVRYLHSLFAGEETVMRRLMEKRLEHAYTRLVRGTAEGQRAVIGEVARASGFKSLPHFCRSFKSRFGLTPLEALRG